MFDDIIIRSVTACDDMNILTDLIHSAYKKHAENNLKYWATHQTVEDTEKRFQSAHGLIAEIGGSIVGTILVRPPQPDSEVPFYRSPETWTLAQFAVLPELQGNGIGKKLHEGAAAYAGSENGRIIALDTAVSAFRLIDMYSRWGIK